MKFASNKAFSAPSVKFRYAFQKKTPEEDLVELPRISSVTVKERKSCTNKRNTISHDSETGNVPFSYDGKPYTRKNRESLKSKRIDGNCAKTYDLDSQASTQSHILEMVNEERKQNLKRLHTNYNNRQQKTYESLKNRYNSFVSEVDHSTGGYNNRSSVSLAGEIIFGIYPVLLALNAKRRKLHCLFYKKGLEDRSERIKEILDVGRKQNIKIHGLGTIQFKQILKGDQVHQGICCDASPLPFEELHDEHYSHLIKPISDIACGDSTKEEDSLEGQPGALTMESREKANQLWLYLDRIHDPMNFGAVLRSAYFMGVDKVLTSEENSCRISGVVSKASAGVAELLPVFKVNDPVRLFKQLDAGGWDLVSSAVTGNASAIPVTDFHPRRSTLLVIGNEGTGVCHDLQKLCSTFVTIQSGRVLHPDVQCLNVSVATSVILHHLQARLKTSRMDKTTK